MKRAERDRQIREIAETTLEAHSKHALWSGCRSCQKFYPCADRDRAEAILRVLLPHPDQNPAPGDSDLDFTRKGWGFTQ